MPYRERLENGLILRSVQNLEDVHKFVTFNAKYNNVHEGMTCDCLLRHHPGIRWDDFLLVEEEASGQIAACICLIPWELRYGAVTLRTAMLEMVLSHPEYRRMGLIRKLIQFFLKIVEEQRFDVSIIWGIPYYYRQYGYTYCIDGAAAEILDLSVAPALDGKVRTEYVLRPAQEQDLTLLTGMYARLAGELHLGVIRNEGYWRYLLADAKHPVCLVEEKKSGNPAGYITYTYHVGSKSAHIQENYLESRDAAFGVLNAMRAQGAEKIRVDWPRQSLLAVCAKESGSESITGDQWLFKIRQTDDFLFRLAAVFEARLLQSGHEGLSRRITINLYREAFLLNFVQGKLTAVESPGFIDSSMGADGGDLCIPPDAFVRLVLGYRTVGELKDAWPDIVVREESRNLIDALFPRAASYISMPYHYQGPQFLFP